DRPLLTRRRSSASTGGAPRDGGRARKRSGRPTGSGGSGSAQRVRSAREHWTGPPGTFVAHPSTGRYTSPMVPGVQVVAEVAIVAVPILVAIVFHEVAHGAVAYACGDATAARAGRLTLNPLPHIDPFGTVILPGLLLLAPYLLGTRAFVF